jgi:hypothetical protein
MFLDHRQRFAFQRYGPLLLTTLLVSGVQAQGLPSLPHIIPNACQLECCRLGEWSTTFSPLAVYAQPGDRSQPFATIAVRTSFAAESSVVVVRQFGIAVVDKLVRKRPYWVNDSSELAPGDTVYLVNYDGEDWFTSIIHNRADTVYAFWGVGAPGMLRPRSTPSYGRVLQSLETEWWVRVRLPNRSAGWINMTQVGSVRGPDACSQGN